MARITDEEIERIKEVAPEMVRLILLVMDANIATAKGIYEADRMQIARIAGRIAALQQEVDDVREMNARLLEEIQVQRLKGTL
ncbi:MAG TPA: hypothetical protein VI750_02540 [Pyrinomonadaceae bacterium]|nr:hypothetical protein [Pyrinomonadaceae bacterium]